MSLEADLRARIAALEKRVADLQAAGTARVSVTAPAAD